MGIENFLCNSVPLLHNVALRQQNNILGWDGGCQGWSKNVLSIKCSQIYHKYDVESFFIKYHQNSCSGVLFLNNDGVSFLNESTV